MNVAVAVALCAAGAAVGLVAYEAIVRAFGIKQAAGAMPEHERARARDGASREGRTRARVAAALGSCSAVLERFAPSSRTNVEETRERLRRAGMKIEPETWRCVRVLAAAACGGAFGAATLLLATPNALATIAAGAFGCAGGWLATASELTRRERRRRAAIEARLPDAMELLGVALAAGSPVEQCFREVASSLSGPLSEELALVDQEVNLLGRTREAALERLARRCASQEVSAFVAQLSQAINQGTSISDGLAAQAALARERAQADALERIRKMPTKLDVVLSLCFLPPTTVLVLVPTVVELLSFLSETMA